MEFLNAFNSFCSQAFKDTTIRSAWKKPGHVTFDPALVVDKIRDGLPPTRNTTPPPPDWIPLDKTPTSVKDIRESMFNQLASAPMREEFRQTCAKIAKGACQIAQKAELLETRLNNTNAAENARKARQRQANKVLKSGDILYVKDLRRMVRDRLELEAKREKGREEGWERRFKVALRKCYEQSKKWRLTAIDRRNGHNKGWIPVMKELLKYTPMYVCRIIS